MKYFSIVFLIILTGCNTEDNGLNEVGGTYEGVSLSAKWDAASTCKTTRYMIKRNGDLTKPEMDSLYGSLCTVSKLTKPLFGAFARYKPYAVSWPNGTVARVFIETKGIRMMGFSTDGIPFSWNNDHKPIVKSESDYGKECRELFVNKVNAINIKITNIKKFDDLSGASVEITYTDKNQIKGKGDCIFDRTKITMAYSKFEGDKDSKNLPIEGVRVVDIIVTRVYTSNTQN